MIAGVLIAVSSSKHTGGSTTTAAAPPAASAATPSFAGVPQRGDALGDPVRARDAARLRGSAVPLLPGVGARDAAEGRDRLRQDRTREAGLSRHRGDRPELAARPARDLRGGAAEQALESRRGAVPPTGRREQRLDHERRDQRCGGLGRRERQGDPRPSRARLSSPRDCGWPPTRRVPPGSTAHRRSCSRTRPHDRRRCSSSALDAATFEAALEHALA